MIKSSFVDGRNGCFFGGLITADIWVNSGVQALFVKMPVGATEDGVTTRRVSVTTSEYGVDNCSFVN